MAKKKQKGSKNPSGIVLYAKQRGLTSFSSLWSIKHALETNKVGHTGTLDSFADGLLVVLSGSLTHLVAHITGFSKTYLAVVCFGAETDTLDPAGKLVKRGTAPSRAQVEDACRRFTGAILQVPPLFSAVHVDGQRASDAVRSGKELHLEARQVFVYHNTLLDFCPASAEGNAYALLEIDCSKGTYIRALARDMATSLGTCAHLAALRRTAVGPFALDEAACAASLEAFSIENAVASAKKLADSPVEKRSREDEAVFADIRRHFLSFTPQLAALCGFSVDVLKPEYEKLYQNGRPLAQKMFTQFPGGKSIGESRGQIAVFYDDRQFAGMAQLSDRRLSYSFVVPHSRDASDLQVFSWEELVQGKFPPAWRQQGTALTVGSFDAFHAGHAALVDAVLQQKDFVPGIVMFRNPVRAFEKDFAGSVSSLSQRLDFCKQKGLSFAVVIDFSPEFSKIKGTNFLQTLVDCCNMKVLAEGKDFRCGYKGACTMKELSSLAEELSFSLLEVPDVLLDGQRVSSSRIREAVLAQDFVLAQKMLLRPFAYSCEDADWREESGWYVAERLPRQLLPPDGTYEVVLQLSEEGAGISVLETSCVLKEKSICLLLSSVESARRVRAIAFK